MHHSAFRLSVLVLLVGLLPGLTWAQAPGDLDASKLSPNLQSVLESRESVSGKTQARRNAEVQALPQRASDGSSLYGVAIETTRPEAIRQAGITVTSAYSDFVVARVTAEDLRTLAGTEAATSVHELGKAKPHNDVAAGVSGVRLLNNGRLNNTNYKGSDVIVCVIDSGIDYTHRDFRGLTDDTKSRILYIWDQTLSKEAGEQNPAERGDSDLSGFTYGVEYTKSEIEDEIDGSPADFVRQEDTDGHGTHVTGTAAGNGGAHPDEKYKGMAPKADIITVKTTFFFSDIIDGMNYCGEVAKDEGKPVVVNMSLGANSGPHDGTSAQDQAIDNFVSSSSGRAVVISAGNAGTSGMHLSNVISAGETASFDIDVPSSVPSGEFRADTWSSSSNDATIEIETPGGTTVGPLTPSDSDGELVQSTSEGRVRLQNYLPSSLGGGDRRLMIEVDDDDGSAPAQGTWTVTVSNTSASSLTHHVWLYDSFLSEDVYADLVGGDSKYTIGTPGSSKEAITVGAFNHRWRWCDDSGSCWSASGSVDNSDDIASFSSAGPLRGGIQKPEITAPGQKMGSSYSDDMGSISGNSVLPGGDHRLTQGTSMSSPVTAGAVALLLQEDPNLTQSEIKTTLQNTARTDRYTGGSLPSDTWGYGKLDAARAMSDVLNSSAPDRRTIIAHDEWGSGGARSTTGDEQIAVQFTPSKDGVPSGVLLHASTTVNLSGPLNVEIWTDNEGVPGTKKGSAVSWDPSRVSGFTWNYLDLTGTGVSVQKGTTYHVVLSFSQSGDDMDVRYDNGTVDGNSSVYSGSSWSSYSTGDFRLRPVVSYSGASGQLPVELATFEGRANDNAVLLSWTTSTETNNAGFAIEHRQGDGTFEKLGFKEGAGTTSEAQSYRFRASELAIGTHTFRLQQQDLDGSTSYSREITVDLTLSGKYKLTNVHPNPIRQTGTASLTIKSAQKVKAEVYNVLGQRVATLHDGQIEANTPTTMRVGAALPSGVYFLRVDGESFSATEKFVRIR